MAKGAHLTNPVKFLIADIHLSHPDWGATKIREELLEKLKASGLDKNFGPGWPSVSAVQKQLTEIRQNSDKEPPELKELDSPWSMGSLDKYPIPYEAIRRVFQVAQQCVNRDSPFSNREAIWTARLSPFIQDNQTLLKTATTYSRAQANCALIGLPFNSRDFDKELYGLGNQPPARATEVKGKESKGGKQ